MSLPQTGDLVLNTHYTPTFSIGVLVEVSEEMAVVYWDIGTERFGRLKSAPFFKQNFADSWACHPNLYSNWRVWTRLLM